MKGGLIYLLYYINADGVESLIDVYEHPRCAVSKAESDHVKESDYKIKQMVIK